jgi:hypothetical protein
MLACKRRGMLRIASLAPQRVGCMVWSRVHSCTLWLRCVDVGARKKFSEGEEVCHMAGYMREPDMRVLTGCVQCRVGGDSHTAFGAVRPVCLIVVHGTVTHAAPAALMLLFCFVCALGLRNGINAFTLWTVLPLCSSLISCLHAVCEHWDWCAMSIYVTTS